MVPEKTHSLIVFNFLTDEASAIYFSLSLITSVNEGADGASTRLKYFLQCHTLTHNIGNRTLLEEQELTA